MPVGVEAIASSCLFDDDAFGKEKAKELFELCLSVCMSRLSSVGTAESDK